MTDAELQRLLAQVRGEKPTPVKPTKAKRIARRRGQPREWGADTVMSKFYICSILDETDGIAYIVGGLGTTEKLVDRLTKNRKKPHQLRTFKYRKKVKPYQIMSYNRRTAYGFEVENIMNWKKIVVIPGTADFRFMLHNNRGRRGAI